MAKKCGEHPAFFACTFGILSVDPYFVYLFRGVSAGIVYIRDEFRHVDELKLGSCFQNISD